jgi:hypothetical protein
MAVNIDRGFIYSEGKLVAKIDSMYFLHRKSGVTYYNDTPLSVEDVDKIEEWAKKADRIAEEYALARLREAMKVWDDVFGTSGNNPLP